MDEETLEIIRNHCDLTEVSDSEFQEAFDEAENLGYVQDGYSNNPAELFAFINGYLTGTRNKILFFKNLNL